MSSRSPAPDSALRGVDATLLRPGGASVSTPAGPVLMAAGTSAQRDLSRHRGALPGIRLHVQGAPEGAQAIGHVEESGAQPAALRVESLPVVGNLKSQCPGVFPHPQRDRGLPSGVLAGVLDRFNAAEIDGG